MPNETKPAAAPETKPATPPEAPKPSQLKMPGGSGEKLKAEKPGDNGPPAPDFDVAAKILINELNTITTRASKLNGDRSAAWKRVQDDCHVHKTAAKDALKVANMTPELQSEYLRSFIGLMKPLGIALRRDLVDLAEGVEGLMIPVMHAPASELEDDGASLATKVMRETAREKGKE